MMRWTILGGLGVLLAVTAFAQGPRGALNGARFDEGGRRGGACRALAGEDGQRQRGPRTERRRGHRPPPLLVALDADRDGVLSSAEIDAASAVLRALDANGDGQVDRDEMRPRRPGRPGRVERPTDDASPADDARPRGKRRGRGGRSD